MKENYAGVDGRKNIEQLTKQQQYSISHPLSKLLRAQHFTILHFNSKREYWDAFSSSLVFSELIRFYYISTKVKPGSFTDPSFEKMYAIELNDENTE